MLDIHHSVSEFESRIQDELAAHLEAERIEVSRRLEWIADDLGALIRRYPEATSATVARRILNNMREIAELLGLDPLRAFHTGGRR